MFRPQKYSIRWWATLPPTRLNRLADRGPSVARRLGELGQERLARQFSAMAFLAQRERTRRQLAGVR